MYRFNYLPQHRVKVSIILNVLLWFHLITVRPASVPPLLVGDKEVFLLTAMSSSVSTLPFSLMSGVQRPPSKPSRHIRIGATVEGSAGFLSDRVRGLRDTCGCDEVLYE